MSDETFTAPEWMPDPDSCESCNAPRAGDPDFCPACLESMASREERDPTMGPHDDCALCSAGVSDAHAQETACDCSEEYGPCEDHSELLVSREGASLRTADELTMVLISDLISCGAVPSDEDRMEITRLDNTLELARNPVSGCAWFNVFPGADETYDPDIAREIAGTLEDSLPDGIQVYSDDGYRIVRVTGGPLS